MPNTLPPDTDIHVRVGRLEATINGLAESQTRFTDQMSDFVKEVKVGFAATHNKIDSVVDKIQSFGKTNWPAIGVVFSIVTVILGYYVNAQVGPLLTTINNNAATIKTLSDEIEKIKSNRYTAADAQKDGANINTQLTDIRDVLANHDRLATQFVATQAEWKLWYQLWSQGLLKSAQ